MNVKERMEQLGREREALLGYLEAKLKSSEFHAVRNAATDLEVLDREVTVLARMSDGKVHVTGDTSITLPADIKPMSSCLKQTTGGPCLLEADHTGGCWAPAADPNLMAALHHISAAPRGRP